MRLAEEILKRSLVADGKDTPDMAKSSNGGIPHKAMHKKLQEKGFKMTVPAGPGKGVALYSNPDGPKTVTVHHDGRFIVQKHGEKPKLGQGPDDFEEQGG